MKEKPQMRCASPLQHIIRLQTKDREKKRAREKKPREREKKKQSHHKRYNINNEEQLHVMLNMFEILGSMSKKREKYYQLLVPLLSPPLSLVLLVLPARLGFDINMSCRYATDSLINHRQIIDNWSFGSNDRKIISNYLTWKSYENIRGKTSHQFKAIFISSVPFLHIHYHIFF